MLFVGVGVCSSLLLFIVVVYCRCLLSLFIVVCLMGRSVCTENVVCMQRTFSQKEDNSGELGAGAYEKTKAPWIADVT